MNTNKISIPASQLIEFVKKNEVVWQMYDSLIELSHIAKNERFKDINSESREKELLVVLHHAKECIVFNPNNDECDGFEDLVKWSKDKDLLILINNILLLCIASCDKNKVMYTAV